MAAAIVAIFGCLGIVVLKVIFLLAIKSTEYPNKYDYKVDNSN